MSDLIQIKRGNEANLPALALGELGACLDSGKLFCGGNGGNFAVGNGVNLVTALPPAGASTRGQLYILAASPYTGPSYPSTILAEAALGAYYKMGEASGLTAVDSQNGQNGTISAGVTLNQQGGISDGSTAMLFNGTSGSITISAPAHPPASSTVFTLEGWFNWTSATNGCLFGMSNLNEGFVVGIDTTGLIGLGPAGNPITSLTSTGYKMNASAWYHVVYSQDATTSRLYVNGTQVYSTTGELTTGSVYYIGFDRYQAYYWKGLIQHVAFYSAALTASDIATHYSIGTAGATPDTLHMGITAADGSYAMKSITLT